MDRASPECRHGSATSKGDADDSLSAGVRSELQRAAFDDEVGAVTAQRGRRVGEREPVTAVFSRRVKSGHEAEYARLAEGVTAASARYPGQLAATILHAGNSRDYAYDVAPSLSDQQLTGRTTCSHRESGHRDKEDDDRE